MSHNTTTIDCPICHYDLEINLLWASRNGRVFCGTCGKSFEVSTTNQSPPAPPEEEKVEQVISDDNCVPEEGWPF